MKKLISLFLPAAIMTIGFFTIDPLVDNAPILWSLFTIAAISSFIALATVMGGAKR